MLIELLLLCHKLFGCNLRFLDHKLVSYGEKFLRLKSRNLDPGICLLQKQLTRAATMPFMLCNCIAM